MTKTFVIQWRSRINGRSGRGTREFSRQDAEHLVEELNRQYPDIHHELADSESLAKAPAWSPDTAAIEEEDDDESDETSGKSRVSGRG